MLGGLPSFRGTLYSMLRTWWLSGGYLSVESTAASLAVALIASIRSGQT